MGAVARRAIRSVAALARELALAGDRAPRGVDRADCLRLAEFLEGLGGAGDDGEAPRAPGPPRPSELVFARADRAALAADLAARHPATGPALLAHELLLAAARPGERARRGVYTTPDPLADFVARAADELLARELGLAHGLVDDATWEEVAGRLGAPVPDGADPQAPFVRVLDPAAGSGAFLLAVVRRMATAFAERRADGLDARARRAHWIAWAEVELPRRLVGFELEDAARALARRNLAALAAELSGGSPAPRFDLRAENPLLAAERLPLCTVVLGNPPWSVRSANLAPAARALVEPWRSAGGERVVERGALRLEMHLQDDGVKFARLGELALERAGAGVLGLVLSDAFLDAPTLRGMRASLAGTLRRLSVVDLGGSRLRGGRGEGVFAVGQGAAVLLGARGGAGPRRAEHGVLAGGRAEKLCALAGGSVETLAATPIAPTAPAHLFVPRRTPARTWSEGVCVTELFGARTSGIVTAHDALVVDFEDGPLLERGRELLDARVADDELRARLGVRDNAGWRLARARERLRADPELAPRLRALAYRPFDARRILWHPALVWCDRRRVLRHLDGRANAALVVCRQLVAPPWRHALAVRDLVDDSLLSSRSRERAHCFPLLLRADGGGSAPNLDERAARRATGGRAADAWEVLAWVYAVLWSEPWRAAHGEELARDFPRIPPPPDDDAFRALAALGAELLALHLDGAGAPEVELAWEGEPRVAARPTWEDGAVRIGPAARVGPVEREAFELVVGAHRPVAKWLRDRRGRALSAGERAAYAGVVARARGTLELERRLAEASADLFREGRRPRA